MRSFESHCTSMPIAGFMFPASGMPVSSTRLTCSS